MNLVDSSGWLEYFADGPNADFFAAAIENVAELVVPSISIYEVFKRVLQQRDEGDALQAVAAMQRGTAVELDTTIALSAAKLSVELEPPDGRQCYAGHSACARRDAVDTGRRSQGH
jgi:predicted nucleic acid-binding protein